MKKKLPKIRTDKEAEDILNEDLSDFINKDNFKRTTFEFATKDKSITIRISDPLLNSVQSVAEKQGVPYQRIIRQAIEEYLKKAS
jgi:predicted DNA binding CopG/RHH family protein